MFRFFRRLLIVTGVAALTAASLLLWLSPDPTYLAHEWLALGRYYQYDSEISELAAKHNLDPALIKAIVWRESTFLPDKVGTSGERGLMQVSEAAAKDWATAEKLETFIPTDLFDARNNLEAGSWYLRRALDRWKA